MMRTVVSLFRSGHPLPPTSAHTPSLSRQVLRAFWVMVTITGTAALLAAVLMEFLGRSSRAEFHVPLMFVVTTLLLVAGSGFLHRGVLAVRRERQQELRKSLVVAAIVGCLFTGLQSYALWSIMPAERSTQMASTGAAPFAIMLGTLHVLHFMVANMFLSFVTVQAFAHRYDHEYYWGLTVCAWFWHGLGVVWGAIFFACLVMAG